MLETEGDIWDFHGEAWIVITTNIGWNKKGDNIMGAGLALQAANRFPEIKRSYGEYCKKWGTEAAVALFAPPARLLLFPTKELNPQAPHLSWKNDSSIPLIKRGLEHLKRLGDTILEGDVAVPLLGCQNGRLNPDDVIPLIKSVLTDDRYILVHPPVIRF